MEAQSVADRLHLRNLLTTQPDWTLQDLAQALGRSRGWVKQWKKRLQAAPPQDEQVLHSQSRAHTHPPPALSALVVARILEIRDAPPQNLKRMPGPKAIRYYLGQEATTTLVGERLPRSTRTIWRILRQHQRIRDPRARVHQPTTLPPPLSSWQIDFKDAGTVPPDPAGKQVHVVQTLTTVDVGTSILLDAQVRSDFTMATAIEAMAATLQTHGLPEQITFDRDGRFVGSTQHRDCPSPFLRLWHCLGVQVTICPPRRPDLNGFVERYHRTYDQRKVQRNTCVTIDTVRYYTTQAVVGKYVTLRLDASDRSFVVEYEGQEIKRLAIQGTGQQPLPFAAFVEQLCAEARANRSAVGPRITQLAFPFG